MASSSYGYFAALVSCAAFGSFAVPIKGETANRVQIDPLGTNLAIVFCVILALHHAHATLPHSPVMQTYKTGMCFLTCWIVLLGKFCFVASLPSYKVKKNTDLFFLLYSRRTLFILSVGNRFWSVLGARGDSRYLCC